VALLKKHVKRVVHVHCKDVRVPVIAQARNDGWSFCTACSTAPSPCPVTAPSTIAAALQVLRERRL